MGESIRPVLYGRCLPFGHRVVAEPGQFHGLFILQ